MATNKSLILAIFLGSLIWPRNALAAGASLKLNPASLNLKVNGTQTVGIVLTPNGAQVIGVDLVMKFDPKLIQVDQVRDEQLFNRQMGLIVDNKLGQIKMALSNNFGVFMTKTGEIVQLRIKAKKDSPSTKLTFQFTPGQTQDTNVVVAHGKDALTEVGATDITILTKPVSAPQVLGAQASDYVPQMTINTVAIWTWLPYVTLGLALVGFGIYNNKLRA